ncbi:MAG: lipopolysaccharide assembly protein LapA domain-containing protein [Aquificaceae bacterium]|nr:lipopolysaccharide assembly protein LapA domain-containing protein [Aquificaceae bacterium]
MSPIKLILALSLLLFFLLFIAQNAGYVDVGFFYTTYRMPLFLLLLFTFALGFFLPSLYFLLREAVLKRHLNHLEEGLKEWSRGYMGKAEKLLSSSRPLEGVRSMLAELLWKKGEGERVSEMGVPAVVGEMLLREGKEGAEESFEEALSKDPENLRALKGLRDFYALKEDWEKALEYQERVFELCERWEREEQKRVKAEIMGEVYRKGGGERFIEKALDLYTTPFLQALYIKHLLSQERTKEAKKQWDKIFSLGYQEEVLWHLIEDQEVLSKLLNFIEAKVEAFSPDTLAMVYIKLNLLTKARELEDRLSRITKVLLQSALSHREQDKHCMEAIKELLEPFLCSCGKAYNTYTPLCGGCLKWGELKLRRGLNAGRR